MKIVGGLPGFCVLGGCEEPTERRDSVAGLG